MSKVRFEDLEETLSIKVGRFLLECGFAVGDGSREAVDFRMMGSSEFLGVLYADPEAKPRKYLFGLIKPRSRRVFLGPIWFEGGPHGATKQNWVFELCGRRYLEVVMRLAKEMSVVFDVDIVVRMKSEQAELETFQWDNV